MLNVMPECDKHQSEHQVSICGRSRGRVAEHSSERRGADDVQVCPPEDCRPFGCPGHEFAAKGLRGCGIDTASAAIGTEVRLEFLVADRGVPALAATATRTIRVVQRCPQGLNYCAADHTCSVVRSVGLSHGTHWRVGNDPIQGGSRTF